MWSAATPASRRDVDVATAQPSTSAATGPDEAMGVASQLARWAERAAALDLDALADAELERLLDTLRVPITRLEATRAQGLAALERRAARRAPTGGATAAELEQRRRNARRQRLAPSMAKQASEAGRAAADHPATGAAFRAGSVGPEHARLIGRLLGRVPPDRRAALENALLELAVDLDPVAFGRRARALVARHEPDATRFHEHRGHDRRSVRSTDTPDGSFVFSGLLHGTAAETARAALHAFRRPDTSDEHRTSEQRDADAFEQLCEAALRVGDAPTNHGVRPHVIIVIDEPDLSAPNGIARLAHSGQPVTSSEVGHLLDDCVVSRIVRDAAGTPIEASSEVRTVPNGLWRALVVRDGGCTWSGCDAPSAWCDVAHGEVAFRHHGRLAPDNAALLCRRHHRRFDSGPFRMVITGDQVRYVRRSSPGPDQDPDPDPDPERASSRQQPPGPGGALAGLSGQQPDRPLTTRRGVGPSPPGSVPRPGGMERSLSLFGPASEPDGRAPP